MSSGFLSADRPHDILRIRDALDRAGYTEANVHRLLGDQVWVTHGSVFLGTGEPSALLGRTAGGSSLETLVRLFLLGVEVDLALAGPALAPLPLDVWDDAGLVAVGPSAVNGLVRLLPYDVVGRDRIVAYDSATRRRQQAADFVIGVGVASMTLAAMTVRAPVGRCLDLGTGNGVQAVHASGHADEVVATDRNPRAVAFAAFTAALNGLGNIETREGSLFEPVAGERFGLIVSNPPFVISPESSFQWRDGGLPVDGLCRRIVAEAPAHLEDGGWCQLLASWAHPADGRWARRLAGWFEGAGCDVWVVQRDVQDAERYAARWIGYESSDGSRPAETLDAWMDFYRLHDVAAVGFGLITMRRTRRPTPWLRIDEVAPDLDPLSGEAIEAGFRRFDWLAECHHDDERLLGARLRAADGARSSGARSVGAEGAALVAGCDGNRTVGEVLREHAAASGRDPVAVTARALATVRALVEDGHLLPQGADRVGG
jgi:methylase of polypeptide subunit release factors